MSFLFLLVAACPAPAEFVASLPKYAGVQCKFEQRKRSVLFRKELVSQGQLWVSGQKLRFDGPNSSLVVSGSEVRMTSGGKTDTLSLSQAPKVEAFLGTFSGLFVGQLDSLDKVFDLANTCDGPRTRLLMSPKKDAVVKKLALSFDAQRLVRVDLTEPSGDEVTLLLSGCVFAAQPATVFQ